MNGAMHCIAAFHPTRHWKCCRVNCTSRTRDSGQMPADESAVACACRRWPLALRTYPLIPPRQTDAGAITS